MILGVDVEAETAIMSMIAERQLTGVIGGQGFGHISPEASLAGISRASSFDT